MALQPFNNHLRTMFNTSYNYRSTQFVERTGSKPSETKPGQVTPLRQIYNRFTAQGYKLSDYPVELGDDDDENTPEPIGDDLFEVIDARRDLENDLAKIMAIESRKSASKEAPKAGPAEADPKRTDGGNAPNQGEASEDAGGKA